MSADQWQQRLRQAAALRGKQSRVRRRRILAAGPDPASVTEQGRVLVNFSSNDYLGLSYHPQILSAYSKKAAQRSGAGASALVTGYQPEHQALEQDLASFFERDAALVFSSGYLANLALASALLQRGDSIVEDKLNHASLIDAARLSNATLMRYLHADPVAARRQLQRPIDGLRLLVTDGVFSMDGDIAPLTELAEAARHHQAWLCVDDAHGLGVVGPGGRGSVAAAGLGQAEVPVLIGTFGKALGGAGAFIAGSGELIDHLLQTARSYIYTTAMPAAQAASVRAALKVLHNQPERLARLQANIQTFRRLASEADLPVGNSTTAIQPLVLGHEATALAVSEALDGLGFLVTAIRPPTVPANTSRLRITLSAAHTDDQIKGLVQALCQCLPAGAERTVQ